MIFSFIKIVNQGKLEKIKQFLEVDTLIIAIFIFPSEKLLESFTNINKKTLKAYI